MTILRTSAQHMLPCDLALVAVADFIDEFCPLSQSGTVPALYISRPARAKESGVQWRAPPGKAADQENAIPVGGRADLAGGFFVLAEHATTGAALPPRHTEKR